jgi:DNA (cytosine-5)-methyltransferase 1
VPPVLCCESDAACQALLRQRYPDSILHDDVRTLNPPRVDVVVGGWPCQDLSIAGRQAGLKGARSGLLAELLRIASQSGASCLVAENVPHLLRLNKGKEFASAVRLMHNDGFDFVGWRLLNARHFGLPQNRTRLIIVASKTREHVFRLFRELPQPTAAQCSARKAKQAAGFYWTAGTHSLNYSPGYVPALKIGSTLGISSLPAIHFDDVVRSLTPIEALRLQGFDDFTMQFSRSDILKMVGNAVPKPLGQWAIETVAETDCNQTLLTDKSSMQTAFYFGDQRQASPPAGYSIRSGEKHAVVTNEPAEAATNLIDYIDTSNTNMLSSRASAGLLRRLARSGQTCPPILREILERLSACPQN